ncbi:MAG: MFS transporter, partial [Bryobacteraceae bacterium]
FTRDVGIAVGCLGCGFFFAELTIGPMWAIPMDIAPQFSGTAAGLMNVGSAFAAIASPVLAGWVVDTTGDWNLPFIGSMILMLLGAGLAFAMHPEKLFEMEAP